MKSPSEPLPDDEPPLGRQGFIARMKEDAGFAEKMQRQDEAAQGGTLREGPGLTGCLSDNSVSQ